MADDVPGSATNSGDPVPVASAQDASDSGTAATAIAAGGERRGVVFLVPPISGEAELDPPAELETDQPEREDWVWVQEWRAGQESTPWATGVALAVFSALLVGVAVWVLSAGLADRPVIAVLVNLLVAAGLAPAIWLSRGLPVLRWIAGGAAAGIVIGWISAILMLPFPAA